MAKSVKKLEGVHLETARFLMTCGTVTHDNHSLTWSPIGGCYVDRTMVTNSYGVTYGVPIEWTLGGINKIKDRVTIHWFIDGKVS